jgi:hypothetical protein
MTRYLKVLWHHELPDEPVELFSEIDDEGWEVRKVEVYRDGHLDWADGSRSKGTSMLSETRMPGIEEIAVQPEFSPTVIDTGEFEAVWRQAVVEG